MLDQPANADSGVLNYALREVVGYYHDRLQRKLGLEYYNLTSELCVSPCLGADNWQMRHDIGGYPIIQYDECFMLPVLEEILPENFIIEPFARLVWILIFITLVFMTGLLRVFVFPDVFLSVFESLNISCGMVNKGMNNPQSKKRIIFMVLYLYGFMINNLYMSKLSSYLTTPNRGKEMTNLQDIKNNNITLWLDLPRIHIFKRTGKLHEFKDYSQDDFFENLNSLNTEKGYLVFSYRWEYIDHLQMLLKKKLFSFSNICPAKGFIFLTQLNIGLRFQTKFNEILSQYSIKIKESGLDYIWEMKTYRDIRFGYMLWTGEF